MKFKNSLSKKITISIGFIFLSLSIVIFFVSKTIIQNGFTKLEQDDVKTNIVRLQKSIDNELENLASICGDWAAWDDSKNFMLGKNENYVSSNLTLDSTANLKLNFMIFVKTDGSILHKIAVDLDNKAITELSQELIDRVLAEKQLLAITEPNECKTGILLVGDTKILFGAQPISDSASHKPVCGTLIVGRYLNETKLNYLRQQTCLDIKIAKSNHTNQNCLFADDNFIKIENKNTISGFAKIYDLDGNTHFTLRIDIPRNIYNYGQTILFYFTGSMIGIALCTMAGLLYIMNQIILKPINKLSSNFRYIEHDYNISTKLYTDRTDEVGSLARSFDAMMDHLKKKMLELAEKQEATNKLNIELTKTTEMMEQANGELRNFVYVASHDLREPLRKIVVFADMLRNSLKDKVSGADIENLHYMIDGAERMKKMIDGLLDYSRVSTQPHPFQKVDVNEVINQLCNFELSMLLLEKNVIIEKPKPLPVVVADNSQLSRLIQNLIANGIKYQPKDRQPRITITSKPAPDGMVRIEITDNGIGIRPEYHSAVFTMFKRLHKRDEYEGSGIGLAVCKKIVERHNGQIGVESQFGQGSTFWFTIAEVPAAKQAVVNNL